MSYLLTPFFYCVAGILLGLRLSNEQRFNVKKAAIVIALLAALLHSEIIYSALLTPNGINFGFFTAVSLISYIIVLFILVSSISQPLENLGIAAFPLAAIAIALDYGFSIEHPLPSHIDPELKSHILLSIIAYSLLSIAAVQAMLLAIQNKHLRNRNPGGFIRALPPLDTMESLLFQLIGAGFIVHSLSLLTGWLYLDDIFAQHLAHKTAFSIAAWMVFAVLLWGRWRYGWRGRRAILWTMWGFTSLFLAYLGSKLVLEIIIGKF